MSVCIRKYEDCVISLCWHFHIKLNKMLCSMGGLGMYLHFLIFFRVVGSTCGIFGSDFATRLRGSTTQKTFLLRLMLVWNFCLKILLQDFT